MTRIPLATGIVVLAGLALAPEARAQEPVPEWVTFRVEAGEWDRQRTPVRFELPEDRFGPTVRKRLDQGPVILGFVPKDFPYSALPIAQAERGTGKMVRVTFVLPINLMKGREAVYRLFVGAPDGPATYALWSFDRSTAGVVELKDLKHPARTVFRYNAAPVSSPKYGPIQIRDAYIHPAFSPSGALITGDFSSSHPHHRGFFLAYEKTQIGDLKPDFWNIHLGTGKIYSEGVEDVVAGPITARFSSKHRWEAKDKATGQGTVVLRERWDVEAYAIPENPYWLFDVTSTQQAVGKPLELQPYRYGGMAYRGPEPFVKGTLDVLTSDGKHRVDGDQKPARWVDLTGPIADGSDKYAGAMIADHPSNPHNPTVARIHPTTLPFFCYVPAHEQPLTIAADAPTVFRYRVLIHDGRPDAKLDDAVARDFAEPPVVKVE